MKTYRAKVEHGEDGWLVAQVVGLRGAITQGRDLDELAYMVRDAIESLTQSRAFVLHLLLPPSVVTGPKVTRKRRRAAA